MTWPMSPPLLALRPDQRVDNAIDYLRTAGRMCRPRRSRTTCTWWSSLDRNHLLGVVGLRDLVVARADNAICASET